MVLESVALLFADQVRLGGFWAVTGLIFALLLARKGVRKLLSRLAVVAAPTAAATPG